MKSSTNPFPNENCKGCLCTIRERCHLAQEWEAEQTRRELARLRAIEAAARKVATGDAWASVSRIGYVEVQPSLNDWCEMLAALAAKGE
jgi:hypothetical protein